MARSGQKAAYRVHSQVPEDEVARGRIGQRLKWPEVEVARGRGGQGRPRTKWPEDEVAKGRSGQRTKWPGDEVARGRSGQGTKWPEFKVARVRSGQRCCDWLRKRAALVLPQPISSRARRRRHWTLPPQQGRIQATYLGRSRQCHDVSHLSRLRVGEGSVGRFRRCRAVLRAAVGVGAQATYLGRSRQCHDVSHLSRLRVGEGSVGRFRRCRAVLRAAVGVGAGREGGL